MKSTIRIDLDFDNNPILTIDYQETEDLRDVAVGRLIEYLERRGNMLTSFNSGRGEGKSQLTIRPVYNETDLETVKEGLNQVRHTNAYKKVEELYNQFIEDYPTDISNLRMVTGSQIWFYFEDESRSYKIERESLLDLTDSQLRRLIRGTIEAQIQSEPNRKLPEKNNNGDTIAYKDNY